MVTIDARNATELQGDGVLKTSKILSSPRRLVLFAVLLPAAIAVSNQWLFEWRGDGARLATYPWMAASTAVLSWCVGRYLQPTWLRWIMFAWCLALLDALTIAACMTGRVEDHVGFVLVSAQISLLVLWSILGPGRWQWRLPGVVVIAPAVLLFSGSFTHSYNARGWNLMMVLTTVLMTLLCCGLRWFGFSLHSAGLESMNDAPCQSLEAHQFGLKHILIWATAAAPLLVVVRGLDYFVFANLDKDGAFPAIVLSVFVASSGLIAIWAIVGGGPWPLRLISLFVFPLAFGWMLNLYSGYLQSYFGSYANNRVIQTLVEMRDNWINWFWLNAALLAALLLFIRASGYRLLRKNV